MSIRLQVLGSLRAFLDNAELLALPGQPLRAALLVYLAVERQVARETLATILWPESDEEDARHALRQGLYNLRKTLGDNWLEAHPVEVRVTNALVCDGQLFKSAFDRSDWVGAATLYGGEFLRGVNLLSLTTWQAWVDATRAQYARSFRRACREWVNAAVGAGDLEQAVGAARRWVDPDPLDDEAQHRLIEVLAAAGERAEAIRQYEGYVRLLAPDELTPLDATKELIESIRRSEPLLPSAPRSGPSAEAPPGRAPRVLGARDAEHSTTGSAAELPSPTASAAEGVVLTLPHRAVARWALAAAILTVLVGLGWLTTRSRWQVYAGGMLPDRALDTTRYAILAIAHDSTVPAGIPDLVLLEDALSQWSGISITPPFQVREAVARRPLPLGSRDANEIARGLGAGRYTLGSATRIGDSLRVQVGLYDSGNGRPLALPVIKLPLDMEGAAAAFERLAEQPLFRGGEPGRRIIARPASRSRPARDAFEKGQQALHIWDLPAAEAEFFNATQHDPDFALAYLWLAQVRAWMDLPSSTWLIPTRQAFDRRAQLTPEDQRLVGALLAHASDNRPLACSLFKQLTETNESGFVGWYGLARCLSSDSAVVPDPRSPTRWAFRSGYHSALVAYQRAFHILPSIHRALRRNSFEPVRGLFVLSRTTPRAGRAIPPDTTRFFAYPDIDPRADTLIFVPYTAVEFNRGLAGGLPPSIDVAVERQRRMFHDIATAWVAAFPKVPRPLRFLRSLSNFFATP